MDNIVLLMIIITAIGNSSTEPHILQYGNKNDLAKSPFNPSNPTTIFIHAYGQQAMGYSALIIRDAYLNYGDNNVILVDWSKLAAQHWYNIAVENSKLVGNHSAKFLKWLELENAIDMRKIHVIGFSLGAEAAGYMGKALKPKMCIYRVDDITLKNKYWNSHTHKKIPPNSTSSLLPQLRK